MTYGVLPVQSDADRDRVFSDVVMDAALRLWAGACLLRAATCVRYARTRSPRRTHEERDPRHPTYEFAIGDLPVAPCHQETVEIYNPRLVSRLRRRPRRAFDGR